MIDRERRVTRLVMREGGERHHGLGMRADGGAGRCAAASGVSDLVRAEIARRIAGNLRCSRWGGGALPRALRFRRRADYPICALRAADGAAGGADLGLVEPVPAFARFPPDPPD